MPTLAGRACSSTAWNPDLVQRPEYPETPEPALGSTQAFTQDDEVVQRHEYPETPELAVSEGGAAARL